MIKLSSLNKKRTNFNSTLLSAVFAFSACKADPEMGNCIDEKNKWIMCPENVYELNNRKACVDRYELDKIEVQRYGYILTTRWLMPNNMCLFNSNPSLKIYPTNVPNRYFLEIAGVVGTETQVHKDNIEGWSFTEYTYSAPVKAYLLIGLCPITCSSNLEYINRYDIPIQSLGPMAIVSAGYSSIVNSIWSY